MKTIILLFSILYISASAQEKRSSLPVDATTKLITYTKVVELKGVTKDSLFNKALAWCNTFYNNPGDVIREQDKAGGKIECKARFKVQNPPDKKGLATDGGVVQYTLTLQFKEGRYKYLLTEYNWKQTSYYPIEKWMDTSNQYYKPEFEHYLQEVDNETKEITASLEKFMQTPQVKVKEDW
jgi:hypothetical protein